MKIDRYIIAATTFLLYLLPVMLFSFYLSNLMPSARWYIFTIGFGLAFFGSAILFALLSSFQYHPEKKEVETDARIDFHNEKMEIALNECQIQQSQLHKELKIKNEELEKLHLNNDKNQRHLEIATQEMEVYKKTSEAHLQQRDRQIQDFEMQIISHQKSIEKLTQRVLELEASEKELTYELNTLLQVTSMDQVPSQLLEDDEETEAPVLHLNNESESMQLLRQCLDTAGKMNGIGRTQDLPIENYVLDMRRLCDFLQAEKEFPLLLYSQKENRLLFANEQIKNYLGWTPEKMVQIFPEIIQNGLKQWREGLQQLSQLETSSVDVPMKTREGDFVSLKCHLGTIPEGLFRNYVIAVCE